MFPGFHQYLGGVQFDMTSDILGQLLTNLVDIKQWFTTQRLFRFIASSILIVYETNCSRKLGKHQKSHEQSETVENMHQRSPTNLLVDTKIIDTAHVFPSTDIDDNYLFGLENLISIFEKCRQEYAVN